MSMNINIKKPKLLTIIFVTLWFLLSFLKMKTYFLHGRFWAEEGACFYPTMINKSFFYDLFFSFRGYIELISNFILFLSSRVNLYFAPLVIVYLSWILQALPIFVVFFYRKELNLSDSKIIGFVIIASGIPGSSEIWANAINTQFSSALLVAIIAAIKINEKYPRYLFRLLIALSGLNGFPANFIFPVYFFLAWRSKNRERWIQVGILLTTLLVQIVAFLSYDRIGEVRNFSFNPILYFATLFMHSILALFFSEHIAIHFFKLIKHIVNEPSSFFLIIFLIFFVFIFKLWQSRKLHTVWLKLVNFFSIESPKVVLIFAYFLLTAGAFYGALGKNTDDLLYPSSGGRYFYAPNLILVLFFLMGMNKNNFLKIFFLCLLLLNSIIHSTQVIVGPDWKRSYDEAVALNQANIKIWPNRWLLHKNPTDAQC